MHPGLERRLKAHVAGDVLFDPFSRGRYATDASHYQMMPAGVVVPRNMDGAVAALQIAREEGVPVTARGGGTSQCGQTVNSGLIIDGDGRAGHCAGRPEPAAEKTRLVVSG
jgi:FAD/FMN-containing dehydrogenase